MLCYLVVLDGLSQRFHLHSLIKLIFMQQVDEIIQRAFMKAHFRVERTHALKNLHTTGVQSSTIGAGKSEKVTNLLIRVVHITAPDYVFFSFNFVKY